MESEKMRSRRGFTLVELLIVIIIIGVLGGMMMISAGSATDKTEETRCLADRRTIKSALNVYRAENGNFNGSSIKLKEMFANRTDVTIDRDRITGICLRGGIYNISSDDSKLEVYCDIHNPNDKSVANRILDILNAAISIAGNEFNEYLKGKNNARFDSGAADIAADNAIAGMSNKLKNLLAAQGIDISIVKSWQIVYDKNNNNKFTIYYSNTAINNDPNQKIAVTKLDSDGKSTLGTVLVESNTVGSHKYYKYKDNSFETL